MRAQLEGLAVLVRDEAEDTVHNVALLDATDIEFSMSVQNVYSVPAALVHPEPEAEAASVPEPASVARDWEVQLKKGVRDVWETGRLQLRARDACFSASTRTGASAAAPLPEHVFDYRHMVVRRSLVPGARRTDLDRTIPALYPYFTYKAVNHSDILHIKH